MCKKYQFIRSLKWFAFLLTIGSCVERVFFDVPNAQLQMVVEGMISDQPGPYIVKVSKGLSLESDTSALLAFTQLKIKLLDDAGNSEDFLEASDGIYKTQGTIRGSVGRSYRIRIETNDGKIFESSPDKINPNGEIEEIRHEFEARTSVKPFGELKADVFNIFIDSRGATGTSGYYRWRYTGTYRIVTFPEQNLTFTPPYTPYKNPFPCSGYYIGPGPAGSGGTLIKFAECSCCTCWPQITEPFPQLSDTQLIDGNRFKNIKVGEVPINDATFFDKFQVEVEQMSLSREAFQFFKLVREQKINASSLFQPPSGEIVGNIKAINSNDVAIGLFWAASISKKSKFLTAKEVPYSLTPLEYSTLPCYEAYKNATTTKPNEW